MTLLRGGVGGEWPSLSALRDLSVFWLLPKKVGEQHVLERRCSSLLFSVSQSHVLSKIVGECGQGNPNIIAIHQIYSQGDCDPSSKASVRLRMAMVSVRLSTPLELTGAAQPWRATLALTPCL